MEYIYFVSSAIIAAYCAHRQKRNPFIWFFLGYFFQIFALIALAILPLIRKKIRQALLKKHGLSPASQEDATTTLEVVPSFSLQTTPEAMQKLWYFLDGERKTVGPMSFQAFYETWKKGTILSDTLVWNETFPEWKSFSDVFGQKN